MTEVWTLYEEVLTNAERKDGFLRNIRIFEKFEVARKVFAERLKYYTDVKTSPFEQWDIPKTAAEALYTGGLDGLDAFYSEEDQIDTEQYLSRFLGGEAGTMEVFIQDEKVTCFDQSEWGELWGDTVMIGAQCPWIEGSDYGVVQTNAFMMDDPEETYFFLASAPLADYLDNKYLFLKLTKTRIE